jgi:hypothetical protein
MDEFAALERRVRNEKPGAIHSILEMESEYPGREF